MLAGKYNPLILLSGQSDSREWQINKFSSERLSMHIVQPVKWREFIEYWYVQLCMGYVFYLHHHFLKSNFVNNKVFKRIKLIASDHGKNGGGRS